MVMVTGTDTMMNLLIDSIQYNRTYYQLLDRLPFLQKKSDFVNPITIDLHSHLLPGIDDGVRTLEESLKIIKKLHSLGYTKLITTPHIISDSYPNTKEIIEHKLQEVREALVSQNINIEIDAAAEHYIDMKFLKDIQQDNLMPFCNKYILFETSYISKPHIFEQAIFDMQSKGYIPVLAHPERYRYMYANMESYIKLKELGVLFQMNIKSLRNHSHIIYKTSLQLMKLGLIDFLGSDAHRMRDANDLETIITKPDFELIFRKNKILNMSLLY